MNDFEQQLARQQWRPIPPGWRQEILDAAARGGADRRETEPVTWWRLLLWPSPRAWAAFAGLWLILAAAHITMPSVDPPSMSASAPAPVIMAEARREQQHLAAELADRHLESTAPAPPRRRSERTPEEYFV